MALDNPSLLAQAAARKGTPGNIDYASGANPYLGALTPQDVAAKFRAGGVVPLATQRAEGAPSDPYDERMRKERDAMLYGGQFRGSF